MMRDVVSRGTLLHHKILWIEKSRLLDRFRVGVISAECRPAIPDRITGLQRVIPVPAVVSHQFRNLSELRERSGKRRARKGRTGKQAGARECRNTRERIRERL